LIGRHPTQLQSQAPAQQPSENAGDKLIGRHPTQLQSQAPAQPLVRLSSPCATETQPQLIHLPLGMNTGDYDPSKYDEIKGRASGSATAGTASNAGGRVCPSDKPIGTYPNCCPRYTISDGHGGCSGSDGSYTPKNNPPARPASGRPTAGAASNTGAGICPPDKPIGAYPNCCPRYTISDGHGGCSGADTVQRGGISYDRSGAPVTSSRPATADTTVKSRNVSTNKQVVPNQISNKIQQRGGGSAAAVARPSGPTTDQNGGASGFIRQYRPNPGSSAVRDRVN
jgi:hypothetical protein